MKDKKLYKAMFLWLGLGVVSIQAAHAGGVIVVDTIADQPQPGFTTLREAVELAHETRSNNINRGSGVNIEFDSDLFSTPQTITLQKGEIVISVSMQIKGPGADLLTIDGGRNSRLFQIIEDSSFQQEVEFSNLTLIRGNAGSPVDDRIGGCIFSNENLTLSNTVFSGCVAPGIGGAINIRNGNLTINGASFFSNVAGNSAAAIYARNSNVNISNSLFKENRTNNNNSRGVVTFDTGTVANISNTTFTDNSIRNRDFPVVFLERTSTLLLNNSTIFGNTGVGVGITNSQTINISNTIIAGNTGGDCDIADASDNSANLNNLDSDGTCNVQAANHLTAADVLLAPLADNGGDTMTLIPIVDSPAIDAADEATCELFDQRGEVRPQDGDGDGTANCDIGAVEGVLIDVIFFNGFEGQ
ncbi:choice-of-anchor Q domain-containing protein [Marinicella sp. W31]|uniref:choice-of-anchor Q domain-containing protein n=1 Tax=Marinicella sp. W31 TaxID=3023713 RepID=UPI0037579B03